MKFFNSRAPVTPPRTPFSILTAATLKLIHHQSWNSIEIDTREKYEYMVITVVRHTEKSMVHLWYICFSMVHLVVNFLSTMSWKPHIFVKRNCFTLLCMMAGTSMAKKSNTHKSDFVVRFKIRKFKIYFANSCFLLSSVIKNNVRNDSPWTKINAIRMLAPRKRETTPPSSPTTKIMKHIWNRLIINNTN